MRILILFFLISLSIQAKDTEEKIIIPDPVIVQGQELFDKKDNNDYYVYMDGVFDLFHNGHITSLKKAIVVAKEKAKDKKVILVVGVCTDEECIPYKREPIQNSTIRSNKIKTLLSLELKDDEFIVIKNGPMEVTEDYMKQHMSPILENYDKFLFKIKKQVGKVKEWPLKILILIIVDQKQKI